MEHVIDPPHRIAQADEITGIADIETQFIVGISVPHIILLLLIPGKNTDLANGCFKEPVQNSVAEGAGTAGYEELFACEHKGAFAE